MKVFHVSKLLREDFDGRERMNTIDPKERAISLIGEIDPNELAVKILEAVTSTQRPEGIIAKQAMDALDEETRSGALRAAYAATTYIIECINNAQKPN